MDLYKKNKVTLSILAAIIIVVIGGVYSYINSTHSLNQSKFAEAASVNTQALVGTCKNTYTRNNNNCGTGCGNYPGGSTTQLWRSYNVYQNTTQFTKGQPYTFVSLQNVYSTGDKWNDNNNTTLLAGKCDGNFGGPYAICCSGSTQRNATKLDPNNPYSDPYQPPEAGCGSYSKIINTPLTCPSPVPTVNLTANGLKSATIKNGDSVTLKWISTHTKTCFASWTEKTSTSDSKVISKLSVGFHSFSIGCIGYGVGASDSATVNVVSSNPPVNGVCNSANNGVATPSAPSTNLCTTGTPSAVSGTGPWTWSCASSNGGTTASCSAPVAASLTHLTCLNNACTSVSGAGASQCSTNTDCAPLPPTAPASSVDIKVN